MATFAGLTVNEPGSAYVIQATSSGLAAGTGPAFDVTNDQLVVTTQPPSSVTAGAPFGLVVQAEDGAGNVDTSFNGSVTLAEVNGVGQVSGQVVAAAVNGVATFTSVSIDQAGVGNSLLASSDGLATATSGTFDVVPGTASQLAVINSPPSNVSATDAFEAAFAVEDSLGNIETGFSGNLTINLANNSTGATLGGTLSATAVNGVADFTGLIINKPGSGYVLQATGDGLHATTTGFDVTPAGVATQLVVTSQPPSTIVAGSSFGLTVTAEDSFGNVAKTFNGIVTLGDPTVTGLGGTLTAAAVNGVVTFSSLTADQAGSNYWLSLSGGGLPSATTDTFTVSATAATQLAVSSPLGNARTRIPIRYPNSC